MFQSESIHLSEWRHLAFIDVNSAGRDFVVGDIHGYFHALERLLDQVDFDASACAEMTAGHLEDVWESNGWDWWVSEASML